MTSNRASRRLSARVSGLRGDPKSFDLIRGSKEQQLAHDSLVRSVGKKRRTYVTGARAQGIADQLGDHDRQLLDILQCVHLASGWQLQVLLWGEGPSAARQARRQLRQLTDLRVLVRLERRPGGVRGGSLGFAYALDVTGQAIVGIDQRRRRPRLPSLSFVAHGLAVTDCYVQLQVLAAAGRIELLAFETEPAAWRRYHAAGGIRRLLKPDVFVITGSAEWEDRWFLEIDRSTESPSRLRTKAEVYISYWLSGREQADVEVFPRVVWVVPDETRKAKIVDVLAALPPEHWRLFGVCCDAEFAEVIIAGAGNPDDQNGELS
jgi:Replication-relaxation